MSKARMCALVAVLIMLCRAGPIAQVTLPAIQAGSRFAEWFAASNTGNRDAQLQSYREHWPSRPPSVDALRLWDQTGGFDVLRFEQSSATRVTALVQQRDSDAVARIVFEISADDPHHIVRFGVHGAPRPPHLAVPRMVEANRVPAR